MASSSSRAGRYPATGPGYSASCDVAREGQLSCRARPRRRAAAARAARAPVREAIQAGGSPPGSRAAVDARARRRARRLARRGQRGLRPARVRGLPRRCARARRCASRAPCSASARASRRARCCRRSPTTCAPACRTWPAFPPTRGCARCARRGARRRSRARRARPARRAGAARGARRAARPRARRGRRPRARARLRRLPRGLSALCRWLRGQGAERVAVEDPGWHPTGWSIEQAGLEVVPVPVDAQGLRVDALERRRPRGRHARAPVPDRRRAEPRAPRRAGRVGRARGGADRRGRLRRELVRPGAGARCRGSRPSGWC